MKRWYNGYLLNGQQVYNPKAVVESLTWNQFQSYWSETGTYESIVSLINMDFDGRNLWKQTRRKQWSELISFQRASAKLLDATLDMECDVVAEEIEKIHMEYASIIQYHDENSLSSVLLLLIWVLFNIILNLSESCRRDGDLQILYLFRRKNMHKIIRHWSWNLNGIKMHKRHWIK